MFKLLIIISVLTSSVFAAEYRRTAIEYNKVGGTLAVDGYYPTPGRQYVIPLNDLVDQKMKALSWRQCIVIKGSLNDEIFYARDIKDCK